MKTKNLLKIILITLIIIGISVISFLGIYVEDKNTVKNILPEYLLGRDLKGYREVKLVKVEETDNDNTSSEEANSEEETATETTENEENKNEQQQNYSDSKKILERRLNKIGVTDYLIRQDEENGDIILQLPENDDTDSAVYELMYQGKFEIIDSDTNEVLMTNDDIKQVQAGYGTNNSGNTAVYISFEFNKEGTEKFKNITNTYVETTVKAEENEEENTAEEQETNVTEQTDNVEETENTETSEDTTVTKEITIKIDGQEMLTTHFDQEITTGILQLTFGSTSTLSVEEIQERYIEARNMAILIDNGMLPIEYQVSQNRYIASDITLNQINIVKCIGIVVLTVLLIYLVISFKELGIRAAISIIGYVAILFIAFRIFNVEIAISGIFAIALSIAINYIVIASTLKVNKKQNDIKDSLTKTLIKYSIILLPSLIISIVFTMIGVSFGTVLFWGIFINILYNLSLTRILLVDKK